MKKVYSSIIIVLAGLLLSFNAFSSPEPARKPMKRPSSTSQAKKPIDENEIIENYDRFNNAIKKSMETFQGKNDKNPRSDK